MSRAIYLISLVMIAMPIIAHAADSTQEAVTNDSTQLIKCPDDGPFPVYVGNDQIEGLSFYQIETLSDGTMRLMLLIELQPEMLKPFLERAMDIKETFDAESFRDSYSEALADFKKQRESARRQEEGQKTSLGNDSITAIEAEAETFKTDYADEIAKFRKQREEEKAKESEQEQNSESK